MKIGIVGTGAMGCVYAALLCDAGNEVWAVDSWAEHVAAMAADGRCQRSAQCAPQHHHRSGGSRAV